MYRRNIYFKPLSSSYILYGDSETIAIMFLEQCNNNLGFYPENI